MEEEDVKEEGEVKEGGCEEGKGTEGVVKRKRRDRM